MKFWDTVAKMCGVHIGSRRQASRFDGGQLATRGFSIRAGDTRITLANDAHHAWIAVNGHGLIVRDATKSPSMGDGHGMRLGFIVFETVKPGIKCATKADGTQQAERPN